MNDRIQEINDLRNAVEFWKQAAETQKHNNLAILKEHRAMKEALELLSDNAEKYIVERVKAVLSHLKG